MAIADMIEKLPPIQHWIADLLARHRSIAKRVDMLGLPRLNGYYAAETLRSAHVVEVDRVPAPPLTAVGLHEFADFEHMDADGITYEDVYFLKRDRASDESLHFHELVHIVQWRLLGPERFVLIYALGHALNGGYANNPLEQIAYALQGQFEGSAPPFSVEPLVKRHLEQVVPALLGAIHC